MAETKVGVVTHYFGKISVAAIKLTNGNLKVGDTVHVTGHTSDVTQAVDSMQLEHDEIMEGTIGQEVAIRVSDHVRTHDIVSVVTPG